MKELVGHCIHCSKSVYCRDGFLEGVVNQDGRPVCFSCHEKNLDEKPAPEDTSP